MSNKEPWGPGTPWKNSVAWFTYLRGCLRKAWSTNPIKLTVLKNGRKQIPNPNPKGNKPTVWGFDCEMCGKTYPIKEGQIDHKIPAGSLQKTEDIPGFVMRLLYVREEDLRLICKGCNSALAYADKNKISFEEALIAKQIIEICKNGKEKAWLVDKGITPAANAKLRKQQVKEVLECGR